jgi:hypothetical protein
MTQHPNESESNQHNQRNPGKLPKLMVCGHARHGKDTLCEYLQTRGYRYISSSLAAADFIFPVLAPRYGYQTAEECWEDRVNHRAEWFDLISAHNAGNPVALAERIYERHDIYCGIRSRKEFLLARDRGLFDISIWVDASDRLPEEGADSNQITMDLCELVIDNNGTLDEFTEQMRHLADQLDNFYIHHKYQRA